MRKDIILYNEMGLGDYPLIDNELIDCEEYNEIETVYVTSSNRLKSLDKNCRHVIEGSVEQPFGILILEID